MHPTLHFVNLKFDGAHPSNETNITNNAEGAGIKLKLLKKNRTACYTDIYDNGI